MSHQEKVSPRVALMAMAAIIVALLFCAYFDRTAHAEPKPGLWQEQTTVADGVTIRKIRDTTGGDFNVCYVASVATSSLYPATSISCIPERRP